MDMELLQKALFNLPRLQNSESGNRSVEKLGQLYSSVHHHANAAAAAAAAKVQLPTLLPKIPHRITAAAMYPLAAVSPNIVFDVASLVLYGTHAIPVRLKILLDRLFSVLSTDEVSQILKGYGWTMDDYQRGYILKDPRGAPLERWQMCSKDEEPLVLQQFLRFGETRPITQQLILQEISEKNSLATAAAALAQQQKHHHHHQQQHQLQHQGPNTPLRSSPSPLERSSPIRHSSPGRRTPSIMGSPPGSLLSPKGPSPPNSSCSNGGPSPLHPLHSQHNPNVPTKTPEIPSSMRIPPTSMAAAAAAGLAAVGGLPAILPNVSHSLASYHNSITNIAKAQQEFSRTNSNKDHHDNSNSNASSNAGGSNNILNLASSLQTKKEPPSYNLPPRSSSESGKNSPSSVRDEENGIGFISQEIRKKMRDNIGISYVNPQTGKKASSIAVHLREMHKCSVEGCNMMFSSRRSRNRHSANPNPKLHTPHLRRKISPHDGRTHQGPSIIPYHAAALVSPSSGQHSFNPQAFAAAAAANPGLIPQELLHRQQMELQRLHELKLSSMYSPHRGRSSNFGLFKNGDEDVADVKRMRLSDSENEGEMKESSSSSHHETPPSVSSSMGGALALNNMGNNNMGNNINSNSNVGQTGGGRKRKSQNPTRLKVNSDGDGDEDFSSDDDDEGFENPMDDYDDELGDTDDDDHRNNPGNNANSNNNNSSTTTNGGGRSSPPEVRDSHNKTEEESSGEGKQVVSEGIESEDNNNSKVGSIKVLSDDKLLLKGGRRVGGALDEEDEMDEGLSGGAVEEEDDQIPLDTENPKRCVECLEEFDNHFLLKTHFTSVHLKLLHKCTIEGCNASFPSKRSRDHTNGFQNEVMARLYGDGKTPVAALGGSLSLACHIPSLEMGPSFGLHSFLLHILKSPLHQGWRHPLFPALLETTEKAYSQIHLEAIFPDPPLPDTPLLSSTPPPQYNNSSRISCYFKTISIIIISIPSPDPLNQRRSLPIIVVSHKEKIRPRRVFS
ncbi:Zinc finger protein basonuclin-2,Zinc finger protein basonuclin-1 [Lepeophtheirus salmonis]|uniref:Zinc finger protein basonuclin-2,Zinc finger protein basonuclin-1 n=1 Tax=Lepeophtheirus salmonis TaxID=72036 RepID=A0A7R8CVH0_LEPSM|nr:Zinc finger protein basonuclin-2,Zinc finger protein basonuclin-1 [Lepeophtheirus salmonis]CAF2911956.1 Zinc finger protein basonuclin-2,Zinc finger protein basonuclin-1 [Lepeophtheirus salmonis]